MHRALGSALTLLLVAALVMLPLTPTSPNASAAARQAVSAQPAQADTRAAFDCSTVSEIPQAECQALVALYNSTNGAGWADHTDWLATATPCSWYGVWCAPGHVQWLTLPNNLLSGVIPSQLANLTALEQLALNSNQLSGSIPSELGSLTNLLYLFLSDNQLSGPLPLSLSGLNLVSFWFDATSLCEPADAQLQAWLASIPDLGRTGVICPIPIPLAAGWNLISSPLVPANTLITQTLMSITGSYSLVYAYNAWDTNDPWKSYNVARPASLNDMKVITEGMGIWLNASGPVTLSITGTLPVSPSINLAAGWNLVGYPLQTTQPVTAALMSITGTYDLVYGYDAFDPTGDPWKSYNVARPPSLNDLKTMGPGWGYWIHTTAACVWTP